jgi:hypothetical protein
MRADRGRHSRVRTAAWIKPRDVHTMMKSTDLRESNDLAWTGRFFRARLGTVFSERQVSPGSMVIVEIG